MRRPDSYASLQPTHSTIVSIINPSYRSLPAASKHTALPRSHLLHQPNPHSGVRGILRAPSPAGSFLGGFPTPATGVGRAAVAGRHPKPYTGTDQQRPPNSVLLTWSIDPNPTFGAHKSSAILIHATSITASISTLILKGNEAIPTAQRACRPRSPKTWTKRSEQPLMTFG